MPSSSSERPRWVGICPPGTPPSIDHDGKWYVPYYADIGAGNSNWTWQAFGGVGYRFDWCSMVLGFRNLSYDMTAGKPIQNVSMTGPILTFNWHW